MDLLLLLILGILVLLGSMLGGIVLVARRKKSAHGEVNYRAFFVMGICFLPIGITWLSIESLRPMSIAFIGIGVTYLSIGLVNRDKWEKSTSERKS